MAEDTSSLGRHRPKLRFRQPRGVRFQNSKQGRSNQERAQAANSLLHAENSSGIAPNGKVHQALVKALAGPNGYEIVSSTVPWKEGFTYSV